MYKNNCRLKMLYKCIKANTLAIWQHMLHIPQTKVGILVSSYYFNFLYYYYYCSFFNSYLLYYYYYWSRSIKSSAVFTGGWVGGGGMVAYVWRLRGGATGRRGPYRFLSSCSSYPLSYTCNTRTHTYIHTCTHIYPGNWGLAALTAARHAFRKEDWPPTRSPPHWAHFRSGPSSAKAFCPLLFVPERDIWMYM